MAKQQLPKLPLKIKVDVFKGESGALLARLPEYDVFTQAEDLNNLLLQVNDLIYTYFDVPKKYQSDIQFVPSKEAQEHLIKVATKENSKPQNITIQSLYAPYLLEKLQRAHLV